MLSSQEANLIIASAEKKGLTLQFDQSGDPIIVGQEVVRSVGSHFFTEIRYNPGGREKVIYVPEPTPSEPRSVPVVE